MLKIFSNCKNKFLTSQAGSLSQKYFSQRQYFYNLKSFNALIYKIADYVIDSKIIRLEILFLESAKKIQKFEPYIFDKLTQIFVFKKLFFFKKKKVKLLISHTCFLDYSGSLCFFVRVSCWLSSLEKGTKPFFFFHFLHLHIAFFFSYMWPHGMCWSIFGPTKSKLFYFHLIFFLNFASSLNFIFVFRSCWSKRCKGHGGTSCGHRNERNLLFLFFLF